MKLVVLKQNRDNYEPTAQEIYEYGQYLGLVFPQDQKFTPLLYEALRAPLPIGWEACQNVDEQGSIVYRNKQTHQVRYDHPLDNFYRQKINKIKSLTENLQIQTILQEKQSWLKDSSEMFKKSNNSGEVYDKKQQFINEIEQEKSLYEEQSNGISISENENDKKIIIKKKNMKSPRIYIKTKKQVSVQKMKAQLMNFIQIPSFDKEQIMRKCYPTLKSKQQNQKMENIKLMMEKYQQCKQKLQKMQNQRRSKLRHLQYLKNQIKIMQI